MYTFQWENNMNENNSRKVSILPTSLFHFALNKSLYTIVHPSTLQINISKKETNP